MVSWGELAWKCYSEDEKYGVTLTIIDIVVVSTIVVNLLHFFGEIGVHIWVVQLNVAVTHAHTNTIDLSVCITVDWITTTSEC